MTCWTAFQEWATLHVELGIGSSNDPHVESVWGEALWGDPRSRWSGLEPSWVDVTDRVMDVTIQRGRGRWTDRIGMSGCVIRVDNADGWITWNAAELGEIEARPGVPLRIRADTADGGTWNIWRGFIESVDDQYQPWERPNAAIVCQDALAQVAHVNLPEQAPIGAGETTDARINRILDMADWPRQWRNLAHGQVTVQASNFARNLADELGITADSEGGVAYAATDGSVYFQNRDWLRVAPYAQTVQEIIGPGGEVCGSEHRVVRDGGDVRNDVTMARAGGTVQRFVDQDSISRYRRRTYNRVDLICESDAQVAVIAQRILGTRRLAQVRLTDVTVPVVDQPSATFIASVDYGWRLQVTWEPYEDGTEWTREVHVMALEHRIRPSGWDLILTVDDAMAQPVQPWGVGQWGAAKWAEVA